MYILPLSIETKATFMKFHFIWTSIFLVIVTFTCPQRVNASEKLSKKELTARLQRLNMLRSEGLRALDSKNFLKAEELFSAILALGPREWLDEFEYNEIVICLARAEVENKQFKNAQEHLQLLLETGINTGIRYYRDTLLAHIFQAQGNPKKAIKTLHGLMGELPLKEWSVFDQKFYLKIKGGVNHYYEELFTQAEHCFEGELYHETTPLYIEILQAMEEDVYRQEHNPKLPYQVIQRIAYSEFQQGHFLEAKSYLIRAKNEFTLFFEPESFHQLIMVCRKLGEYQEAFAYSEEFFTFKFSPNTEAPIKYERGCIYYEMGEKNLAKQVFGSIIQDTKDKHYEVLSRLFFAKILIEEKKYAEVEEILHPENCSFATDDLLRFEWAYLRSEALYCRHQYEMSAAGFKEALNHPNASQMGWYQNALYNLGFCYLKLGEDELLQNHSKEKFLYQAENAFQELLKTDQSDRTILALARTYLLEQYYLKDLHAAKKAFDLVDHHRFETKESELDAHFILADMTQDVKAREKKYEELTGSPFEQAKNYGKTWYYRAAFLSQQAHIEGNLHKRKEAIECYKKAYQYLIGDYSELAQLSVKNMVGEYLMFTDQDSLEKGFQELELILETKVAQKDQSEFDFTALKVEYCLKLMGYNRDLYFKKGKEALATIKQDANKDKMLDKILFLEGSLHYHHGDYESAKNAFLELIEKEPKSNYIGESLFWAAECCDLKGDDKAFTKEYRKTIFEDYPDSTFAPEAYFLYYSFADYLDGDIKALSHLQELQKRFPDSPYVIAAYYLQGLQKKQTKMDIDGRIIRQKDLPGAIALLNCAKESFLSCWDNHRISSVNAPYFTSIYYRSILAQAQAFLEEADHSTHAKRQVYLEKALELFSNVYSDFTKENHEHATIILNEEAYPKIFEEAEFGRALTFAKNSQIAQAEEAFGQMIERYHQFNIEQNHYLSRAWYELGMIASAKKQYEEALGYFNHAEGAMSKQLVNADLKIDLGIQQSLCYRFLNQFDMAMLSLSKAINEGVVSNLRVKAMVLRAEIYELQGRRDLAQKQLEAASKKGGEWGKIAQEKLIKDYGFN